MGISYIMAEEIFILAPKHLEKKVEVKKDILFKLLTAHDGDLSY